MSPFFKVNEEEAKVPIPPAAPMNAILSLGNDASYATGIECDTHHARISYQYVSEHSKNESCSKTSKYCMGSQHLGQTLSITNHHTMKCMHHASPSTTHHGVSFRVLAYRVQTYRQANFHSY